VKGFMKFLIIVVAVLSLVRCGTTKKSFRISSDISIADAQFGIYKEASNGQKTFVASNTVPLNVGQVYGWKISLKTSRSRIKWREEFKLPAKPKTWGDAEAKNLYKISQDRTLSTTEQEVSPKNGKIGHTWSVASGDPNGEYEMRVYIEDVLVETFRFHVE